LTTPSVGTLVYFWTGRGSHGYAIVRAQRTGRWLLDPEPDAIRGSDARTLADGRDYWAPRDFGVGTHQLDTHPVFWFSNY